MPIPGRTVPEILDHARRGEWDAARLDSPTIPRPLADLCRRCLAGRPEDRPATALEVAKELECFIRPPSKKRVKAITAALVVLLLGTIAAVAFRDHRPAEVGSEIDERSISLSVTVRVRDRYLPLPDPAPVTSGSRIRIEATLPDGATASLWSREQSGRWQQLARREPATSGRFTYPAGVTEGVRVDGNGTEVVLLLVGDKSNLSRAEAVIDEPTKENWPTLPPTSVLSLEGKRVRVLQKGRDLGNVEAVENPEGEVIERLESLARRLEATRVRVRAVAFRSMN